MEEQAEDEVEEEIEDHNPDHGPVDLSQEGPNQAPRDPTPAQMGGNLRECPGGCPALPRQENIRQRTPFCTSQEVLLKGQPQSRYILTAWLFYPVSISRQAYDTVFGISSLSVLLTVSQVFSEYTF